MGTESKARYLTEQAKYSSPIHIQLVLGHVEMAKESKNRECYLHGAVGTAFRRNLRAGDPIVFRHVCLGEQVLKCDGCFVQGLPLKELVTGKVIGVYLDSRAEAVVCHRSSTVNRVTI